MQSSGTAARPLALTLFWISCLLSIVSFYTTREGMALYLSPWISFLAAFGVQAALVMVAWLFGITSTAERRRGGGRAWLLVGVYAITAVISIAFSYVSLNTWFAERERPAIAQRELYDELNRVAGRAESALTDAAANGRRYTLALEEMAESEKQHGHLSRARDREPYLDAIREAVAQEGTAYKEGTGAGVRYSAFARHAQLTRQTTDAVDAARAAVAKAKSSLEPGMATEAQLRQFRQAYDSIPWQQAEQLLGKSDARPVLPDYARFVERSASGQEDMMRAFEELLFKPGPRNVFSAGLAAFIDIIVFLLAFAAGPHLQGEKDDRWFAAAAALDSHDRQVFARDLLRKMRPGRQGMPRVDASSLTPGEQQFCLLLVNDGQAVWQPGESVEGGSGEAFYLFDAETHRRLAESVAAPALGFRAAAAQKTG